MRLRSCLAICVAVATFGFSVGKASAGFNLGWTIDTAVSQLQLNIPQQPVPVEGLGTINVRLRNQSGGTVWNQGNIAKVGGTIGTKFDAVGNTIEFVSGAGNVYGINSGSYKPSESLDNNVNEPAVFAAKAQGQVLIFLDIVNMAIRDVFYDAFSAPLAVAPGFDNAISTFAANQISFGIQSASVQYFGFGVAASLGSGSETIEDIFALNTAASATIEKLAVPYPWQYKMTIPINIPIAIPAGDVTITGTATGQIVAYATVPEASSFVMAGLAISAFAAPSFARYRRKRKLTA